MKVLETILSFLTTLARIIFPRRPKPSSDAVFHPCPHPLPAPPKPPLPSDERDGGDDDLYRGNALALHQGSWGNQALNVTGCCLMVAGAAGCVYKWFIG